MSAIIFDFDGTIADSFDFVVDFLADEARINQLEGKERQALRHLSMVAMARDVGHSRWKLPSLFFKARRKMLGKIGQLQPFDGMPEVIRKLHAEGHELFILSSNNLVNLRAFLEQHKLREYFLEIYAGVGLFGKAPALRALLKEQNIDVADAMYIGDEMRDINAAQSVNMRIISVLWGFARPQDLKAKKPTATADTPEDIIRIIEEL